MGRLGQFDSAILTDRQQLVGHGVTVVCKAVPLEVATMLQYDMYVALAMPGLQSDLETAVYTFETTYCARFTNTSLSIAKPNTSLARR